MQNLQYSTWQIYEIKLLNIHNKYLTLEWEDNRLVRVPISCLEYGLENFWNTGHIIEISICEWFLIKNNLI